MPDQFGLPSYTAGSSYGSSWGTGNGLAAASESSSGGGGMWLQAAGAALSFFSAGKKDKADAKAAKEKTQAEILGQRQNSQFDNESKYYYQQLGKQEAMRGLDEFRKFSTVKKYAPEYTNTNPNPVAVPTKPVFNEGAYAPTAAAKSSGKKSSGLFGIAGSLLGI